MKFPAVSLTPARSQDARAGAAAFLCVDLRAGSTPRWPRGTAGAKAMAILDLKKAVMARFRPAMRRFYHDPARHRTYLEQLGIRHPTVRADSAGRAR